MSAVLSTDAVGAAEHRSRSVLPQLAAKETTRYLRHPLFLLGFVLTWFTSLSHIDRQTSVLSSQLYPAAGIGLFGLLVMNGLARSGERVAAAAGEVPTSSRTRNLALVAALIVPLTVGLAWFTWAVWAFNHQPPGVDGAPFGGIGHGWAYAVLFALGTLSCVGGPVLGLVLARWVDVRGAPPVFAVLLILAVIVTQGVFAALRPYRLVMPWTGFSGPWGIDSDPNRVLILQGSPGWYAVYLALLCVLGVLVALIPGEDDRRPLLRAAGVVAVLAVAACVFASITGVPQTMVNPVHSIEP